jgi:hypothetical protein
MLHEGQLDPVEEPFDPVASALTPADQWLFA